MQNLLNVSICTIQKDMKSKNGLVLSCKNMETSHVFVLFIGILMFILPSFKNNHLLKVLMTFEDYGHI